MPLRRVYELHYSKPSAKAPVSDPGDEAPSLVEGGEGNTRSTRLLDSGEPSY